MKKVYICSPLGGDVENNLQRVKKYTEYALRCGTKCSFVSACTPTRHISEAEIQEKIGGTK